MNVDIKVHKYCLAKYKSKNDFSLWKGLDLNMLNMLIIILRSYNNEGIRIGDNLHIAFWNDLS